VWEVAQQGEQQEVVVGVTRPYLSSTRHLRVFSRPRSLRNCCTSVIASALLIDATVGGASSAAGADVPTVMKELAALSSKSIWCLPGCELCCEWSVGSVWVCFYCFARLKLDTTPWGTPTRAFTHMPSRTLSHSLTHTHTHTLLSTQQWNPETRNQSETDTVTHWSSQDDLLHSWLVHTCVPADTCFSSAERESSLAHKLLLPVKPLKLVSPPRAKPLGLGCSFRS
jgi:hypothetical protein